MGTGAQGPVLLDATLKVMKNIKRILVSNPHSPHKVPAFIDEIRPSIPADVDILPVQDLETAVRSADIILTATPSRRALILDQWLKPGTHLSCIGSDMEGKQELEEQILGRAKVFCDDLKQVVAVGECEKAVKQGILPVQHITEMGNVILGLAEGRCDESEITVFDSTGIGLQDLMVASKVTDLSAEKKLGLEMFL